jgi:dTDP-4-dehydrorhamnose reductase
MRVLILGASGMLGHKLFQRLGESGHQVTGVVRADRAASPLAAIPLFAGRNVAWNVDAMNWPKLAAVLQEHRPEVVVNALGVIKQRTEITAPAIWIHINALLPHLVADEVATWGGRLIHISSDCVFSGTRGGYLETDLTDADDLYGRTKALGEVTARPNAVTLRTSIIGRELHHHRSLLDWLLSQNPGRVQGYSRVIYSGTTTIEMATVVDRVIRQQPTLHGLYQVATEPISKDALIRRLIEAYRLDIEVATVDTPVSDRSFSGARLTAATGYVAPPWPRLVEALATDPTPYPDWLSLISNHATS